MSWSAIIDKEEIVESSKRTTKFPELLTARISFEQKEMLLGMSKSLRISESELVRLILDGFALSYEHSLKVQSMVKGTLQ